MESIVLEYPEPGVATVTLNRPERANAINKTMLMELGEVARALDEDAAVQCVVVTGAGGAFSSGFDLKEQALNPPRGISEWEPVLDADFKGIMTFWHLSKPSIAAVNGPALAGGFELMLGCDLAVAADGAVFGEPEQTFGAGIVAMLLPWHVPPKVAKRLIYTGVDDISAEQARDWGLVNEVVELSQLMPTATRLARRLVRMDGMALQRTKKAINRTYEIMGLQAALRNALEIDLLIEGEGTSLKRDFLGVLRESGMKDALMWRARRFQRD